MVWAISEIRLKDYTMVTTKDSFREAKVAAKNEASVKTGKIHLFWSRMCPNLNNLKSFRTAI